MDTTSAIRKMLADSGLSAKAVSTSINRNRNYISVLLNQCNMPRANTLARIADACGYDLVLMPRDGAGFIVVDGGDDAD